MTPLGTQRMLQAAGLLLWAMVGVFGASRIGTTGPRALLWWIAFACWGTAFAWATRPGVVGTSRTSLLLLAVQTASALAMASSGTQNAEPALLVAVAGQAPFTLSTRRALAWVLAQTVLLVLVARANVPVVAALANAGAYLSFELFALGAGLLAESERRARQDLAVAHAELLAARELLADQSRVAERLRISRDLHDTLGHHLTALSLNLEVASHLAEGKAVEHVRQAHAVTRLLLAEVRDVVGSLRDERPVDLGPSLFALARAIPVPAIHLSVPADLSVRDAAAAHTVLRCVQEIVTNAVRHSGARNLWIEMTSGEEDLRVRARDDGCGVAQVRPGNGLVGMRERLEQSGGGLSVRSRPGHGFELEAWLPLPVGP